MNTRISTEHSFLAPSQVRSLSNFDSAEYEGLRRIGIDIDKNVMRKMIQSLAMDSLEPLITTASMAVPIQFLQNWLPGFVHVITAARNIDKLVGISTSGSWEDEEIVQGILELTGTALPYGDYANNTFADWNPNYERRTVVRFEEGIQVGLLEEARSARARIDSAGSKRNSAGLSLEIQRNKVGFYGFNSGDNRTYGFLNDPGLPAYVNVPNGASGSPLWANKTFLEIVKDIKSTIATLRNNSKDQIDPENVDITMGVATAAVDYLSTPSDFGISVRQWMKDAYPRIRVVSAPELNAANGGANVFYMYADTVQDGSDDDKRTFLQVVPMKFKTLGVQQLVKAWLEGFSNATAGVMCKRPYAVVRRSGI